MQRKLDKERDKHKIGKTVDQVDRLSEMLKKRDKNRKSKRKNKSSCKNKSKKENRVKTKK